MSWTRAFLGLFILAVLNGNSGCAASKRPYDELKFAGSAPVAEMKSPLVAAEEAPAAPEAKSAASPAAKPEAPNTGLERKGRLLVYDASMYVVVDRVADSLAKVRQMAESMGGYMLAMETQSITIKVPAGRFQEALSQVEALGTVTRRDVKGVDVTEEMRDLRIRLKNAEEFRERLLAILKKTTRVQDALKVEEQLERVTETIELLKGKINYLENNIAYSTITVWLSSPLPQKSRPAEVPFAWVYELGDDFVKGTVGSTLRASVFAGRIRFDLPEGYITYFEDETQTRAMSADDEMILVRRHENFKGGEADFWAKLIRRVLGEQKAIAIKEQVSLTLKTKATACLLVGGKEIGNKPMGYLVAVVVTKQNVYTFEAWGPQEAFGKDRPKLVKSIESLAVGP